MGLSQEVEPALTATEVQEQQAALQANTTLDEAVRADALSELERALGALARVAELDSLAASHAEEFASAPTRLQQVLAPDEQRLYQLAFRTLTAREALRLFRLGAWRSADSGEIVARHGGVLDTLSIILSGRATAERDGRVVGEWQLIGQVSFFTENKSNESMISSFGTPEFAGLIRHARCAGARGQRGRGARRRENHERDFATNN